jgi:hypothetical protein
MALESAMRDPTVIVGMACRAPGAVNTSQLWSVIADKKDLRRKVPEDRFNVDAFYHPQGSNKGTVCRTTYILLSPMLRVSRLMEDMDTSWMKISLFLTTVFSGFLE